MEYRPDGMRTQGAAWNECPRFRTGQGLASCIPKGVPQKRTDALVANLRAGRRIHRKPVLDQAEVPRCVGRRVFRDELPELGAAAVFHKPLDRSVHEPQAVHL